MKEILVVLGAPNSPTGELSIIAQDRLNYCIKYAKNHDVYIICTGGFGKHFNITNTPHADYAKEYLICHGIAEKCFLDSALSGNTIEDALKVREILIHYPQNPILIVTSDFHLNRVELIFNQVLHKHTLHYAGVTHALLPTQTLNELISHEKRAIESIIKNGFCFECQE